MQHSLGEVHALFFSDIGQHAAFVSTEGRAAGDADVGGQFLVHPVEVEVLDHAATAGRVGIHVQRHGLPGGNGRIHLGQRFAHLAPVTPAGRLVMGDVQVHPGIAADGEAFVDGVEQPIRFVAHVRGVERAVRGCHGCQGGYLFGLAVTSRTIDQTAGKTARPLLQRMGHVPLHCQQLRGRGRALLIPHDHGTHGVVPYQHHVVDGRPFGQHGIEVTRQIREIAFQPGQNAPARGCRIAGRIRRHGAEPAIAADNRRHALGELEGHVGVAQKRAVIVRVRIDEARRKTGAMAVDLGSARPHAATYLGDATLVHGQLPGPGRIAQPVQELHVAEHQIMHGGSFSSS